MKNALTFDLEDYYHVSAFGDIFQMGDWSSCESRLQRNTEKILQWLDDRGCQATFFVLGWVAEHYAEVVSRIAECGHEIACHSYQHRLVYEMSPEEFREDTHRAKSLLEDVCGRPVVGYRAPSFSVNLKSFWALELLAELGFIYDSSIFPVDHPNYGMPQAPRFPFLVDTPTGSLVEFPMPTLEFAGMRSPLGGGAYLRVLPYVYTRWGIRFINERESQPVCVYLHPWELDPDQPRIPGNLTSRIRHYIGLRGVETKLRSLLLDFEFCSMGSLVARLDGFKNVSIVNAWVT